MAVKTYNAVVEVRGGDPGVAPPGTQVKLDATAAAPLLALGAITEGGDGPAKPDPAPDTPDADDDRTSAINTAALELWRSGDMSARNTQGTTLTVKALARAAGLARVSAAERDAAVAWATRELAGPYPT